MTDGLYTGSIFERLSQAVVDLEDHLVRGVAKEAATQDVTASDVILNGIVAGLERAGAMYDDWEFYLPELTRALESAIAGLDILKKQAEEENKNKSKDGVLVTCSTEVESELICQRVLADVCALTGFEYIEIDEMENDAILEMLPGNLKAAAFSPACLSRVEDVRALIEKVKMEHQNVTVLAGPVKLEGGVAELTVADLKDASAGNPVRETIYLLAGMRRFKR